MDGDDDRRDALVVDLRLAIETVKEESGKELARTVGSIVWINHAQGRVDAFLDNGSAANGTAYVQQVVTCYESWHPYLRQLQQGRAPQVWLALLEKLQTWAYNLLWHYAFAPRRMEHSHDCATDAAAVLLKQRFPYDTDFDAWAHVILRNVTLKYVRQTVNPKSVPAHEEIELEAKEGWLQNLRDTRPARQQQQRELREEIVQAMQELSEAQQQFILLYYFEERGYDEIARIMDRSKNALYKLNYDAIKNLRKNWE